MTARRGNGEGTVPKPYKSGFRGRIMLGGTAKDCYGQTPAEVRRKYAEARKRFEAGQSLTDSRAKVAAWAEVWRTVKLPATGARASSRDRYWTVVKVWVIPALGDRPLAAIRESDCEAVLLAMKAAGKSPSYRRLTHTAMASLFGTAKRELLIPTSPMEHVARPVAGKSKAVALTPEQTLALIEHLGSTLQHLVPFLALSGTRRGEALGLRWEDIDEEAGVIHLRWQVTRDSENGLHLAPHKTDEAEDDDEGAGRDLELTPALAEVLAQRRKRQARHRLAAPVGTWGDSGLVFTTRLGGLIEPNNVNRAFRQAAARAGLPTVGKGKVTPHSLRHSVATLLLASGTDEKVVAEVLGHSSPRITRDVYQHVVRTQREAALGKVGEALGW